MSQTLVSAIITSYKRPASIVRRAVNSVLSQTYENIELILVDDNREDEEGKSFSKQLETLISDSRMKIIKTADGKHGAQAARNTGISNANGDFIAFLDDDDEWYPEKIEKQVELLLQRPDAGMAFCRGEKKVGENSPTEFHGKDFRTEVDYKTLLRGDCIGTTTQAMLRKKTFEVVGMFDEDFPARQDYEMWIRISKTFPIVGVDKILFCHYMDDSDEQISRSWDKCIEGHTKLYHKYQADIDRDKKAKFNVFFYLAHYYMCKKSWVMAVKNYAYSFFLSPESFWDKGIIKIHQLLK